MPSKRKALPRTVDEAVERLVSGLPKRDKDAISKMDDDGIVSLHHSLGRWIRNSFGLWAGNEALLSDCARVEKPRSCVPDGKDVHPDDASTTIMLALRGRLAKASTKSLVENLAK